MSCIGLSYWSFKKIFKLKTINEHSQNSDSAVEAVDEPV